MRGGYVAQCYVPPRKIMELRELVRYRANLVRTRSNVKNRIHAYLLMNNVRIDASSFSKEFTTGGIWSWTARIPVTLDQLLYDSFSMWKQPMPRMKRAGSGLTDYLKSEISRLGYPLEINASRILWSKKWFTSNNAPYVDPDEGIPRVIDILAFPPDFFNMKPPVDIRYEWGAVGGPLHPLILMPHMCVECKKSETYAWVFFERSAGYGINIDVSNSLGQLHEQIGGKRSKRVTFLQPHEMDLLGHHYLRVKFPAISYSEIRLGRDSGNPSKSQRDDIFTASMQLTKFMEYHSKTEAGAYTLDDGIPLIVFFPVIIFDGRMFSATVGNDEVDLKATEHVVLEVTSARSGPEPEERSYLIDVVSKGFFPKLCDMISEDLSKFGKSYVENIDFHRREFMNRPSIRRLRRR